MKAFKQIKYILKLQALAQLIYCKKIREKLYPVFALLHFLYFKLRSTLASRDLSLNLIVHQLLLAQLTFGFFSNLTEQEMILRYKVTETNIGR